MEHGASLHLEEQSHTEMLIKTEPAESAAYVEIEVDLNSVKEEPGLIQIEKKVLSAKEDVAGNVRQDSLHGNVATTPSEQKAQSQLYTCTKCPKIYKSENSLMRHCQNVHVTGGHKCPECNKEYKSKDYLRAHVKYVHSKQQYDCVFCKQICKSKKALGQHVAKLHKTEGSQPRSYICDYCQMVFKARNGILLHITRVHASRSYKCSQCKKRYSCKQYLYRHTVRAHTGQRLACNVCGKIFGVVYLKQHMTKCKVVSQRSVSFAGQTLKSKRYCLRHPRAELPQ